jgi:hypothetical protein
LADPVQTSRIVASASRFLAFQLSNAYNLQLPSRGVRRYWRSALWNADNSRHRLPASRALDPDKKSAAKAD